MLSANQTLNKGRYLITNEFGSDGICPLFKAYDTVNNSSVVLREIPSNVGKVLTTSQRDAAEAIFLGNAKVLTKIKHKNLVGVRDYFSEVENRYLVLEDITGFDLTKFLKPNQIPPDVNRVTKWALDLLEALEHLHKLSPPIIHGNINPKNIRFRDEHAAKLLAVDVQGSTFMQAASLSEKAGGVDDDDLSYQPLEKCWPSLDQVTQRSILRDYDERSERILRHGLDARSDLYGLGACIYHVLTGIEPISALDRAYALREGKSDPLAGISDRNSSVPETIASIFMKALSLRREFRFYSAAVMADNLRSAMANLENGGESEVFHDEVIVLDEETPLEGLPIEFRREEIEAAIASDEHEVRLELELTQSEERQRQLEAEQSRLEEEQKRIEERRAALEIERLRHKAEKERLEQKAKLESERKENERRAEEKKRLEAEAMRERELASQRLAEIETELEQRRLEAEKIEREIEEERVRAIERLNKVREEKERSVNEQLKHAEALKRELERAEQRLQQIAKSPADAQILAKSNNGSVDEGGNSEKEQSNIVSQEEKTFGNTVGQLPPLTFSDAPEITFHSVSSGPSSRKKLIATVTLGFAALLGGLVWFVLQSEPGTKQPAAIVTESPTQASTQAPPAATESSAAISLEPDTLASSSNSSSGSQPIGSGPQITSGNTSVAQQSTETSNTSLSSSPPPTKKRAAAPAKPQSQKKVTADDLINDN